MTNFTGVSESYRAPRPDLFGARRGIPESSKETIRGMVTADFYNFSTTTGTSCARITFLDRWALISSWSNTYQPEDVPTEWKVIGGYAGGEENNAISEYRVLRNFRPMADMAFRYQLYGDEADAAAVCRILHAFGNISSADTTEGGSQLHWTEWWPILIQAAEYVSGSPSYTAALDTKLKATSRMLYAAYSSAYTFHHQNNWVAWGLSLEFALAGFLNDQDMHDQAVYRWRQYFREGVKSHFLVTKPTSAAYGEYKDNVPWMEVYRERSTQGDGSYGLLYSNHALNGMVMAAEWARHNGTWLYDYVAPDGSSLRGLWEAVSYQNRYAQGYPTPQDPTIPREQVNWFNTSVGDGDPHRYWWTRTYPYVSILQNLWPLDTAGYFITQARFCSPSGSTAVRIIPVEPTETAPDPNQNDIDYFGMRNAEFIYRVPGLFAK